MEAHIINRDIKKRKFSKLARFRQWIKNLFTRHKQPSSVTTDVIQKDDEQNIQKHVQVPQNHEVKLAESKDDNLGRKGAAILLAAAEIVSLVVCLLAKVPGEQLNKNAPESEKEEEKDLPQVHLSLDEILRNEVLQKKQKPKPQQVQVKPPSAAKEKGAGGGNVATVPGSPVPPGYANKDCVSCYANAICQCMFSFDEIITCIGQDPTVGKALKKLCQNHAQSKGLMDTRELRREVGSPFSAREQQDAEDFFSVLVNQNESLKALTTSIVRNTRKCRKRSCGHEITAGDLVNCIRLGTDKSRIHITELIKEYSKWECLGEEVHCGMCDSLCAQNSEIEVPAQILICQLMLWTEKGLKKNIKVEGIADTVLQLKNKAYQLQAAVFHHSNNSQSGHYTAIRRHSGQQWIKMNDTKVSVENKWPRGKTPYLLFYKSL
ncbi:hypothetical protein JTE90_004608 [Oedothorax gibbosus]|uniref:USP domain-containing protein n=1 Tax=Oedothorax gibbosus TaxID=931172 RepID=A0AAV6UJA1_9ARAC|nr:hypothetical protein JTE90_004608 [Oedothorax gibbosus]